MTLYAILKFITTHPLTQSDKTKAVMRFVKWQMKSRITQKAIVHQFTSRTKHILKRGMTGATGNLYCGLQDFDEMSFVLHFLRKDDIFLDIGANIGTYTILASGHVGAHSIAFEPSQDTATHFNNNIKLNNIQSLVELHNNALGASTGECFLETATDIMNNHICHEMQQNSTMVRIEKLDDVLSYQKMPNLIKMDVEGYEYEILKAATTILKNPKLKAMLVETMGLTKRYGASDSQVHELICSNGFAPYEYDSFTRNLQAIASHTNRNTLYIRDLEFVKQRVETAENIQILNKLF